MMTRKILIKLILICVIVVFVLSTSSFGAEKKEEGAAKINVTYMGWFAGEKALKPYFLKIKTLVEEQYPNIILDDSPSVPFESLHEQFYIRVLAGDPPDIGQVDAHQIWDLIADGALEPLDNWISKEMKDELLPDVRKNCTIDGKLYYLPWDVCYLIFYRNRELAARAGFDAAPETIDDFKEQARKIGNLGTTADGSKIWGYTHPLSRGANIGMFALPFLYNAGGRAFDDEGNVTINSPEALEVFNFFKELADEGVLGPLGAGRREARVVFGQMKSGFTVDNTHSKASLLGTSGIDPAEFDNYFETILYPSWKLKGEHWSMTYPTALFMFKDSKHKKEAIKVIEFLMLNDDAVDIWNTNMGGLPGTKSARKKYTDTYSATVWEGLSTTRLPFVPHQRHFLELGDLLSVAVQKVISGEMDPESALEELESKYEAVIKK